MLFLEIRWFDQVESQKWTIVTYTKVLLFAFIVVLLSHLFLS